MLTFSRNIPDTQISEHTYAYCVSEHPSPADSNNNDDKMTGCFTSHYLELLYKQYQVVNKQGDWNDKNSPN